MHVSRRCHRDIKPENILLSGKGVPKVSFFLLRKVRKLETLDAARRSSPILASPCKWVEVRIKTIDLHKFFFVDINYS